MGIDDNILRGGRGLPCIVAAEKRLLTLPAGVYMMIGCSAIKLRIKDQRSAERLDLF